MQGVMLDCSRNGVMTVGAVKKYVLLLEKMGYDTLMLYTEETYELEGEPYFGYLRGRYSQAELKEMDSFCLAHGIELVPCIQTLAHLKRIFRWECYEDIHDCDDILLVEEEKTYQLVERMFDTLARCFTSRRVHIGMDEASRVGLGKYLEKRGYQDRFQIINRHLHRVCGIAREHGFQAMIWSDMFCRLALDAADHYGGSARDQETIRQKATLPENVSLVYWDYYSRDYDRYARLLGLNQAFGRPVYFAGGAWTWKGFAPDNTFSLEATLPALRACRDCGADGWFLTVWGDDGSECSMFTILPSLLYAMEVYHGNEDLESIKAKFRDLTGADWDAFLLMDQLDVSGGVDGLNRSKYLLYNDPFLGIQDSRCSVEDNGYYAALAQTLAQAPGKGRYAYIFDMYVDLCRVLAVKSDLGCRTRAAYQQKDMATLKTLAEEVYPQVLDRLEQFHRTYRRCWMEEKKPHGFDVQELRIGGLQLRLRSCRERLLACLAGDCDGIPELEETILPVSGICHWSWTATANVIDPRM